MDSQTQITEKKTEKMVDRNRSSEPDSKPVTRKVSEFASSIKDLADLQIQLLKVDIKECVQRIRMPAIMLVSGLMLGAACFPVLLATVAFVLVENFELSYAAAFGIAVGVGMGLSLILCLVSLSRLNQGLSVLQRSQQEFVRNLHFVKGEVTHNRISRRHLFFDVFGGQ